MQLWDIYNENIPDFVTELCSTTALRRLRAVGMNCGCEYTSLPPFRGIGSYSRYDHSVGAALIVLHFTGDPVQTCAALFHDIATPVFAHVVDFMRGDYLTQESTETGTEEMILGSGEICRILKRYDIPVSGTLDYHRYPVADNDSPRLSADRLEYTLGNSVNYGFADRDTVRRLYSAICVGTNGDGEPELSFSDRDAALEFSFLSLKCARVYVSDADRYAMQILSELLRDAVRDGAISPQDLSGTEPELISKLTLCEKYALRWREYCALSRIVRGSGDEAGEGWRRIRAKKRCIDPLVAGEGRVSALFPEYADALNTFRAETQDYPITGI